MASIHPPSTTARPPAADLVSRHKCFRGLRVEQNLLAAFTMYTVELDQFGLFISDSRPEAFNMAFEALFGPSGTPRTLESAS